MKCSLTYSKHISLQRLLYFRYFPYQIIKKISDVNFKLIDRINLKILEIVDVSKLHRFNPTEKLILSHES